MNHDPGREPIEEGITKTGEGLSVKSFLDSASMLKLFGGLILITCAWVRMESKTDAMVGRQERIEQELTRYVPRELQALHDQLVLDKLDAMRDELKRLGSRIDNGK